MTSITQRLARVVSRYPQETSVKATQETIVNAIKENLIAQDTSLVMRLYRFLSLLNTALGEKYLNSGYCEERKQKLDTYALELKPYLEELVYAPIQKDFFGSILTESNKPKSIQKECIRTKKFSLIQYNKEKILIKSENGQMLFLDGDLRETQGMLSTMLNIEKMGHIGKLRYSTDVENQHIEYNPTTLKWSKFKLDYVKSTDEEPKKATKEQRKAVINQAIAQQKKDLLNRILPKDKNPFQTNDQLVPWIYFINNEAPELWKLIEEAENVKVCHPIIDAITLLSASTKAERDALVSGWCTMKSTKRKQMDLEDRLNRIEEIIEQVSFNSANYKTPDAKETIHHDVILRVQSGINAIKEEQLIAYCKEVEGITNKARNKQGDFGRPPNSDKGKDKPNSINADKFAPGHVDFTQDKEILAKVKGKLKMTNDTWETIGISTDMLDFCLTFSKKREIELASVSKRDYQGADKMKTMNLFLSSVKATFFTKTNQKTILTDNSSEATTTTDSDVPRELNDNLVEIK